MEEQKTYKEFAAMLREVADLCDKYGDEPIEDFGPINLDLKEKCSHVVNRGAYDAHIIPWMRSYLLDPNR